MKNKRGDIPITIFVLGVVAICSLAILSFIVSEKINVKSDELGTDVFEKLYSDVEKFEFYKNVGESPGEAAEKLGFKLDSRGLIVEDYNSKGIIVIKKYSPSQ